MAALPGFCGVGGFRSLLDALQFLGLIRPTGLWFSAAFTIAAFFRRDSVGVLAAAYASSELYNFHIVVHVNSLFRFCICFGFCSTGDEARGVRPHRT